MLLLLAALAQATASTSARAQSAQGLPADTGRPPVAAPATTPAGVPGSHRDFLCVPYLGVNQPTGNTARAYSPGLRVGGLLGYQLLPFFSLNAELGIDVRNVDAPAGGYHPSEALADFTFSPLLHLRAAGVFVVAGPKLGLFRGSEAGPAPGDWY